MPNFLPGTLSKPVNSIPNGRLFGLQPDSNCNNFLTTTVMNLIFWVWTWYSFLTFIQGAFDKYFFSKKPTILSNDVIFFPVWKCSLSSISTIRDILCCIPVIHPNLHIYSVALFSNVEIKIADVITFWKFMKKPKTLNFFILLWWLLASWVFFMTSSFLKYVTKLF